MKDNLVEWSLYCDAKGCGTRIVVRCATDEAAVVGLTQVARVEGWSIASDAHHCAAHAPKAPTA